jgi:hypothetical protein
MKKSATDVMQEILSAAVLDAVAALKAASRGVPNNLLRDIGAIHANTTLADLPAELQAAISANVRAAFARLLKEGYSVSPGQAPPQRDTRPPRPSGPPGGPRGPQRRHPPHRDGPRREGPRPGGPGGKSGRPPRKPAPR